MPRVLWKGAISFGLVHIPVGLYSAEKRNELSFTMLDRRNLAPVGYKRVNKENGDEVPWEEIVKGYEYEDGRYVVLSDEDFRRANVEATQTVDIVGFVDAGEIPPYHFETPYYLAPLRRGEKGYALLRETLRRAGKVGVARVVIRTKQHLAALIPVRDLLLLDVLRYADEIRPATDLALPPADFKEAGVSEKEVDMALKLVEGMSEEWDASRYTDTYREDILARIDEKIAAGETSVITQPAPEEGQPAPGAEVIDLMALLRRSLEGKPTKAGRAEKAANDAEPARARAGTRRDKEDTERREKAAAAERPRATRSAPAPKRGAARKSETEAAEPPKRRRKA